MTREVLGLTGGLLALLLAGCRCDGGPVDPVELGLRVHPASLDFGRALEGETVRRDLRLSAETRAALSVGLSTDAPFTVAPAAEVPAGGETTVMVAFLAGDGEVHRVLRLQVGDRVAEVPLTGEGVRPPPCLPSTECVASVYSLELGRCVESPSPDDAPCDPKSLCLEQGRCVQGRCLGVARRCDDDDACTDDACAMETGCVHTPHACPRPANPCQVATCDARAGCGEAPAADGTLCGSADCVTVNVCTGGACTSLPTPDGVECRPEVACLPVGRCEDHVCTGPTSGAWPPEWTAVAPGEPEGALVSGGGQLYFSTCGLERLAGDAGPPAGDGGSSDAGHDGDAGVRCALASFTGTGFERFVVPFDAGARPAVWAVTPRGVLLADDAGLSLHSTQHGGALARWDVGPVGREQVVVHTDGVLAVRGDGALLRWSDAGLEVLADAGVGASLAQAGALFAWDADAGVVTRVALLHDGGTEVTHVAAPGAEGPGFSAGAGSLVLGTAAALRLEGDGGAAAWSLDWAEPDGGRLTPSPAPVLVGDDAVTVFFRRCAPPLTSCPPVGEETWVRAVGRVTGATLWEARVLPAGARSRLVEAVALDVGLPGAVATLVQGEVDGGPGAWLQVFIEGERGVVCALPETSADLVSAHFAPGQLAVLARRADGGSTLESYPLKALPVSDRGWPTAHGLDGWRVGTP